MGPFGQQGGFTAWLLWLGIHITYLIGFANRLVVLTRWAYSFLTHGRGTRLITGRQLLPPIDEPNQPVIATEDEEGGTGRESWSAIEAPADEASASPKPAKSKGKRKKTAAV